MSTADARHERDSQLVRAAQKRLGGTRNRSHHQDSCPYGKLTSTNSDRSLSAVFLAILTSAAAR